MFSARWRSHVLCAVALPCAFGEPAAPPRPVAGPRSRRRSDTRAEGAGLHESAVPVSLPPDHALPGRRHPTTIRFTALGRAPGEGVAVFHVKQASWGPDRPLVTVGAPTPLPAASPLPTPAGALSCARRLTRRNTGIRVIRRRASTPGAPALASRWDAIVAPARRSCGCGVQAAARPRQWRNADRGGDATGWARPGGPPQPSPRAPERKPVISRTPRCDPLERSSVAPYAAAHTGDCRSPSSAAGRGADTDLQRRRPAQLLAAEVSGAVGAQTSLMASFHVKLVPRPLGAGGRLPPPPCGTQGTGRSARLDSRSVARPRPLHRARARRSAPTARAHGSRTSPPCRASAPGLPAVPGDACLHCAARA